MGKLKPISDKIRFMSDIYGYYEPNGRPDGNRLRTGSYMADHSAEPCDLHEAAATFGTTSHYGPGRAETCTADHLRPEVLRIARRSARLGLPYKIVWHGKYMASLGIDGD
jgi:hypothetical protein